jgi:hypothetical protein
MRFPLLLTALAWVLLPGVVHADDVEHLAAKTVDRILAQIDEGRPKARPRFHDVVAPKLKPLAAASSPATPTRCAPVTCATPRGRRPPPASFAW